MHAGAPDAGAYESAEQATHAVEPTDPEKLPAEHGAHDAAPPLEENDPGAHALQTGEPDASLYAPAVQGEQDVAPMTGIGVLELTRLKGCRATLLSGGGTSGEAMFRAEWD